MDAKVKAAFRELALAVQIVARGLVKLEDSMAARDTVEAVDRRVGAALAALGEEG